MNLELIKPLERKEIDYGSLRTPSRIAVMERVLFLDPIEIYRRIENVLDTNKRHAGIQMDQIFPKIEGGCACGCGKKPDSGESWQRKWATHNCQSFASDVLSIINNYFGVPAKYITLYAGNKCSECPNTHYLELDHIVGVKQGGGGCWLSNYRWLCKDCHNNKTNKDFKRKQYKSPTNSPSTGE